MSVKQSQVKIVSDMTPLLHDQSFTWKYSNNKQWQSWYYVTV